jgi:hypothetical protein
MSFGEVLAIIGAVAAVFSAAAAYRSARTASVAIQPWVLGSITGWVTPPTPPASLTVTVQNQGGGLAVDVRVRVYVTGHIRPRATVPGFDRSAMPSGSTEGTSVPTPGGFDAAREDLVVVETEFGDASGARWRITNTAEGRTLARIRSGSYDFWRPR